MRVPKKFLIRGHQWSWKLVKDLVDRDGNPCTGLTDVEERVIYICKSVEALKREWVFWHEYSHAVLYEAGVTCNSGGIAELAEEIICDAFAYAFTTDKEVRWKRKR